MSDIAERVKKIVVEHLGVDEAKVQENASFVDDLGADSLDTVELVMAFEEEFGVEIPDDAAEKILTVKDAIERPARDLSRIVLPPASFLHEHEKIAQRRPAAVEFIKRRRLNEVFGEGTADVGIIVQGGLYNTLNRAMELLSCSDAYGHAQIPVYVMNVTYPVIEDEILVTATGHENLSAAVPKRAEEVERVMAEGRRTRAWER